ARATFEELLARYREAVPDMALPKDRPPAGNLLGIGSSCRDFSEDLIQYYQERCIALVRERDEMRKEISELVDKHFTVVRNAESHAEAHQRIVDALKLEMKTKIDEADRVIAEFRQKAVEVEV